MKKIIYSMLAAGFFGGIAFLCINGSAEKEKNINAAMGTLANIAETHEKTESNVKQLNDIFHDNEKKSQP